MVWANFQKQIPLFKFIHTADIHLDSPLLSLALRDPDAAELVANATRQSFEAIIDLCLTEKVDALLIAGDLYDGGHHSMKTAGFLTNQLHRLDRAGIAVFIIRGNHDAISKITRQLQLPDNVHVFGPRHETVKLDEKNIAIHGVSFAKPDSPESLLPGFAAPVANAVNIGMLHTSLSGAVGHDDYAPCSLADLKAQGYDYWALGHIHRRDVHAEAPNFVVMPGIPQGRHINEAGAKSITLVRVDDNGSLSIEERFTSLAQFEKIEINIGGLEDWAAMVAAGENALISMHQNVRVEAVIARIRFVGESGMAAQLRRDQDLMLEEMRAVGQRIGAIMIESIGCDVDAPLLEMKSAALDPVNELRAILAGDGKINTAAEDQIRESLKALQQKLPPELRDTFGKDDAATEVLLKDYIREGNKDVLARLQISETGK